MTVKHTGIFIGLFLLGIGILLLEIQDSISQPEIIVYLISALLTIGVLLILYSLVRSRERSHHQEN